MNEKKISKQMYQRLPKYLDYLRSVEQSSAEKSTNIEKTYISAPALASALEMGEVLVRKDLALVSGSGKPKVGYYLHALIKDIELFLRFHTVDKAVVVGAGKLGMALFEYENFKSYGTEILTAFDSDEKIINNESILNISDFKNFCISNQVKIGIITVPSKSAQQVCDLMVESGIVGIVNFAPVHLTVPEDIVVQNQDFAPTFAILSRHIGRLNKQKENLS